MKKKLLILIGIIGIVTSCSNDKAIFKVDIIEQETGDKIEFVPNMPFELIKDSTYFYFSKEDYYKVMVADISKGKQIYKSDKFEIRVILRKYMNAKGTYFEFVLRSFSKDFKIIDSYVMASTIEELNCNGVIDGKLNITTTCADGTVTTATVDEYGKFIINE
ncbi:hypothetical protein [Nonlabens agnitus]|uniref:Uncharacterized protein n=1 Tax=Nonlabens agnitus TaxID=870484 RepID=A0A2S9WQC1_9FLAO|nr:hypothetical protein [Nonlabens agnitus]PRP65684.1 hypothetical protein BST86_00550 [Nonlabens agnitus]